jgi:hypothetical protein
LLIFWDGGSIYHEGYSNLNQSKKKLQIDPKKLKIVKIYKYILDVFECSFVKTFGSDFKLIFQTDPNQTVYKYLKPN